MWLLVGLLGWLGRLGWKEYDFRAAVREVEAAEFNFYQSPGLVALIRADWHAAFRRETWLDHERRLDLPDGSDLAALRPLLLRLRPTWLHAEKCRHPEALRALTGLRGLDLSYSDVKDLAMLASLAKLQHLCLLGCTGVADLAPLANLAQLQRLYLEGTGVADLSPLVGLAQLREVRLYGCTGLSEEAEAACRQSHPKAEILGP